MLSHEWFIRVEETLKELTWLHLSDWHQRGADFDRKVVRDALIRDIQERQRIAPALAQVNFVIFSGDLAFSGEASEYEAARKELLDPVLTAVGLEPGLIFFVPGNHDLNRGTVREMLPPELQKPLDSDVLVQKWLVNTTKRLTRWSLSKTTGNSSRAITDSPLRTMHL